MTPENDVDKENEKNNGDEPLEHDSVGETPLNEDAQSSEGSADSSDDTLQHADPDDVDLAASAQSHADEAIAKAMAGDDDDDDDPLGFGDQRMEGDDSAESPNDSDEDDVVVALRNQLSDAEAKISNHNDQLLRLQAEMENQRKRAQNDVSKANKFALEKIALDLLPVKDSLEMGLLAATGEDAEPSKIIEGSELTLKMLAQALEKYNIVEINPVDEKFDPEFHQAMSMQPVEGKEPNTVATVMQKGYTLNDRLIRPALVMVAK